MNIIKKQTFLQGRIQYLIIPAFFRSSHVRQTIKYWPQIMDFDLEINLPDCAVARVYIKKVHGVCVYASDLRHTLLEELDQ